MTPTAATTSALLTEQAARTPQAPALVAGEDRWSYARLDAEVTRATARLHALGIGPGDRLGLLATNTAAWPTVALAAHRLGARVDAFHTWAKAWDLDHLLRSSECSVLVTVGSVGSTDLLAELDKLLPELRTLPPGRWRSERFPALRRIAVLGDATLPLGAEPWDTAEGLVSVPAHSEPAPDSIAFVLYTSGSTSTPKAVPLLHRDVLLNAFHIGERMGLTSTDRVWLGSPLFWSFGSANGLMATLTHGACLILQERFAAEQAAALLRAEECTAAYLLPTMVDALLPFADAVRAVRGLRTGLTIGSPEEVRRAVEDLGVAQICNVYGSTEVYGNCCVTHHDAPLETRLESQGPPLPGVELRVVDEDGRVHTADATGELHVRGRVMPCYLGDTEATAAALTEDGWFRTGDRVRLRPDGGVAFVTRLTEMIKTSGINVSPAEVENYLCRHPRVLAAAVVGAPHPARGEVAVAFVTPCEEELDAEDVLAFCREGMAGYKVPWEIVLTPELPRTGTGKILRRALSEEAAERTRTSTAPANPPSAARTEEVSDE